MPWKKKTYNKKKTYTKSKKPSMLVKSNLYSVNLGKGFPKTLRMSHKYNDLITLTSNGGAQVNHNFSANGMYDPDVTGVGHQPMYFDQMTALYNHYTVIGSRIKYVCMSDSVVQGGAQIALYLNDDSGVVPTISSGSIFEQPSSKAIMMPAGSNERFTRELNFSAKKTFGGRSGDFVSNSLFRGSSVSNPTDQEMFTLSIRGINLANVTIDVQVFIEYICIWSELKDIQGS